MIKTFFYLKTDKQNKEGESPIYAKIELQGNTGNLRGLAVGKMSSEKKELVQKVMTDLLAPYRQADRDEAMKCVTAAGGVDKIHLSYYQQEDIGKDNVWDIWRLEGPGFVWNFRTITSKYPQA